MKILKFKLGGATAFFKKPDVNTYVYFTYGNIHKVALIGMLGAIVGYGGYCKQFDEKTDYPEFYEKLKDIKVGIVPVYKKKEHACEERSYFNKKIQSFNNTVGYANLDGTLIVNEQWLEDPYWEIYLLLKGQEEEKIADYICNYKAIFIPYLGKNDHPANISDIEILEAEKLVVDAPVNINSLFIKDFFSAYVCDAMRYSVDVDDSSERIFKYEERLPVSLEFTTNQYETKPFVYTNNKLTENKVDGIERELYKCKDKVIFFF